MSNDLTILVISAASIGFFHTLLGPDHYLPFIVMSKSGRWSFQKTMWVTFLCGLGHVLSSVLLGMIGVFFGIAVTKLEAFESFRGNLAAWAFIAFGLVYLLWGIRQTIRNRPHEHVHSHGSGIDHQHIHQHHDEHLHVHTALGSTKLTPWVLFTIFVLGPCEPLIPFLMYPAAQGDVWGLILVTAIFGFITVSTMLMIVLVSVYGINFLPLSKFERYTHAIAGATIFLSGMAIQFLGL